MEPERRRVLWTASRCLHALLSDVVVPDCARDHYQRALSRLQSLASDERWVFADDVPEPPARGDLCLGARQAIGELIGLGTPWADLYPVLADVVSGWDDEHVALSSTCQADAIVQTFTLPLDHYLLYGIARTQLVALTETVPATSLIDYWFVLQTLDSLHDPTCRPSADPPGTSSKPVRYAAARAAITALCAFNLDNRAVLSIRDVLDREWERDADHSDSHLAQGGA